MCFGGDKANNVDLISLFLEFPQFPPNDNKPVRQWWRVLDCASICQPAGRLRVTSMLQLPRCWYPCRHHCEHNLRAHRSPPSPYSEIRPSITASASHRYLAVSAPSRTTRIPLPSSLLSQSSWSTHRRLTLVPIATTCQLRRRTVLRLSRGHWLLWEAELISASSPPSLYTFYHCRPR